MSVLTTVLIASAAVIIGFIIGFIVGAVNAVDDYIDDSLKKQSTEPNPVKLFNAPLKPKEEVHEPIVVSKVVMPKRIKELEFNKRANVALKEVIDKAVDVWVSGDNKAYKRRLANELYHEWHAKIDNVNYREYRPNLQRLNFIGRRVGSGFKFEAFWESKDPKRDVAGYVRGHK